MFVFLFIGLIPAYKKPAGGAAASAGITVGGNMGSEGKGENHIDIAW
jgi:hypothetical protein